MYVNCLSVWCVVFYCHCYCYFCFFFFKQKTAYEMRISDWSSDVCSSDLTDGEIVYLRSTANLSTGGTATDVTDIIHPDNRDMAVRAVRAIGLDVGGVDFITPNIAESYKSIGGAICEVNAAPGFRMHVAPSEGTARDAAGPVIDMLFPPGPPARETGRLKSSH